MAVLHKNNKVKDARERLNSKKTPSKIIDARVRLRKAGLAGPDARAKLTKLRRSNQDRVSARVNNKVGGGRSQVTITKMHQGGKISLSTKRKTNRATQPARRSSAFRKISSYREPRSMKKNRVVVNELIKLLQPSNQLSNGMLPNNRNQNRVFGISHPEGHRAPTSSSSISRTFVGNSSSRFNNELNVNQIRRTIRQDVDSYRSFPSMPVERTPAYEYNSERYGNMSRLSNVQPLEIECGCYRGSTPSFEQRYGFSRSKERNVRMELSNAARTDVSFGRQRLRSPVMQNRRHVIPDTQRSRDHRRFTEDSSFIDSTRTSREVQGFSSNGPSKQTRHSGLNMLAPIDQPATTGCKVIVSNLQSSVSQEDIVELFGDIGPMKRAKMIELGTAEVIFVKRDDALKAIDIYHNRQLDGKAMKCNIVETAGSSDTKTMLRGSGGVAGGSRAFRPEVEINNRDPYNEQMSTSQSRGNRGNSGSNRREGSKSVFNVSVNQKYGVQHGSYRR